MGKKWLGLGFVALFVLLLTQPLLAGEYTVFGPQRYERGKGKPVPETADFSSREAGQDFLVEVRNGDDGKSEHRVTSAVITINGKELFSPSDFKRNVGVLSGKIALNKERLMLDFGVLLMPKTT